MSDRIIDCPVKVIVIADDCGRAAAVIAQTMAIRSAKSAALGDSRLVFDVVAIGAMLLR
jgi:hypothetical protein